MFRANMLSGLCALLPVASRKYLGNILKKQEENTTCPFRDGQTQYRMKIGIKIRTALATVESALL